MNVAANEDVNHGLSAVTLVKYETPGHRCGFKPTALGRSSPQREAILKRTASAREEQGSQRWGGLGKWKGVGLPANAGPYMNGDD